MTDMGNILEMLHSIREDNTVPKNVRSKVEDTLSCLNEDGDCSKEVIIDRAIQSLDEISNDPNLPMFTRTQLWSVISALESE